MFFRSSAAYLATKVPARGQAAACVRLNSKEIRRPSRATNALQADLRIADQHRAAPLILLVLHARNHRAAQAEPGHAEGDVGRAAAEILGEARRIFQRAADLLRK